MELAQLAQLVTQTQKQLRLENNEETYFENNCDVEWPGPNIGEREGNIEETNLVQQRLPVVDAVFLALVVVVIYKVPET